MALEECPCCVLTNEDVIIWIFIIFHVHRSISHMLSFENIPIFFPLLFTCLLLSPHLSFLPSLLFSLILILKHWASFSLQLSPEEGYVSAKEDSFLHPPHSCEEEGLADRALFRADLALVSGHNLSSLLSEILCV